MHPPEVKAEALRLIAAGFNDCEVGRRLGIPRRTVRDWRSPTYVPVVATERCPRCWQPAKPIRFTVADYAELLGLYLGDGCISRIGRTYRLRITLDVKYPDIVQATEALLRRCFSANRTGRVAGSGNCLVLSLYSSHLPCLLPQHGAGKKHERRLRLEDWQLAHVLAAPGAFLRACVHTDGCRFVNKTGRYEYPSYHFSNKSRDIAGLAGLACQMLGVRHRLTHDPIRGLYAIRINRREDVAILDGFGAFKR